MGNDSPRHTNQERTVQEWFTAACDAAHRAGSKTPDSDVCRSLAGALCWNLDHGADVMTRDDVIAALRGYIAGCESVGTNATR